MALNGTTISKEGLEYLCGLINKIVSSPKELLDDINLATNTTFSSVKIDSLISDTLQHANTHAEELCGALVKLTAEKTTTLPTLNNSEKNVIYLYSNDGNAPFEQYLKISDTELIDMGSTTISLTDYLTATEIARDYVSKLDFNTLSTEVTSLKTKVGSDTLTTTKQTLTGAINELNDKSTMVTLTQAEYNQLVANGKIDNDTYYIISDDSENLDIVQTISSTSTSNQIPSAQAVFNLDSTNFKMNSSLLFESNTDCTDSKLVIGQEYTAKEPLLPHKIARLNIWWRPCQLTQASWYDDTWGFIDGYFNEFEASVNYLYIYTIRILYRHADTRKFKVLYSKRLDYNLSTNTFTCTNIEGNCGFGIQIFK